MLAEPAADLVFAALKARGDAPTTVTILGRNLAMPRAAVLAALGDLARDGRARRVLQRRQHLLVDAWLAASP